MPTAACPYCGVVLEKAPKRKTSCPACHQPILVRGGRLLTEERVDLEGWIASLGYLGVTELSFEERRQELSKRFGAKASPRDTAWSFLNGAVGKGDWRHHERVYLHMARIVESEGKSAAEFYAEARRWEWQNARAELERMRHNGITHVRILNCHDDHVCPACRALEGRIFPITDALAGKLVPHVCQHECRCWYTACCLDQGTPEPHTPRAPTKNRAGGCLTLLALSVAVCGIFLLM
jgi:SPP1 gp7 family putative phage head morphogenesis protein